MLLDTYRTAQSSVVDRIIDFLPDPQFSETLPDPNFVEV